MIDYGSFDDLDGDGYPDLNPVFFPIFVDKDGKRLAAAGSLHSAGVAGYTLQVQVFGFGHLYMPLRPPVSTTLRAFTATPFDIHAGLLRDSPDWVKRAGLQWCHRLLQEPQRLWKRYLLNNPRFLWKIAFQLGGLTRYRL